jgi:predicted lipoprotein with Yx(FWY)xxD motif/plastocyanin
MRGKTLTAALGALALLAASCGGGGGDGETDVAGEGTTTTTSPADGAVTVAVADSELGSILVDGEGRTLYLFTNDEPGTSTCADACAENWPPLEATEPPVAGDGADGDLLGSITRDDGTTQVTYADMPLYHFAADQAPGDTHGQGVGDVWFVVGPDGAAITAADPDDGPSLGDGYGAGPAGETGDGGEPAGSATTEVAAPPDGDGASGAAGGSEAPPTTAAAAPTTTTTAPPTTTTTTAREAATASIRIENFAYSPPALQVAGGTVVTATNADSAPHTWTADDGSWDSGTLGQGDGFQHTFDDPGTFSYHCAIHPSMRGTVAVG